MATNFYAILTEDTPVFTITAGMEANIIDAAGAQTINVEAGGELDLEGALGANELNFEGNSADYTVTGDGAGNMTFTHTATGAEVVLAARDEAQRIMFNDGAADLVVVDDSVVMLGEQSVTNAAGEAITGLEGPEENIVDMAAGQAYTATDGVVDVFQYEVDSSTGRVVGQDGEVQIDGFNPAEDRLEFVDAGDALTDANFTAFDGVLISEMPIEPVYTTVSFDPADDGSSNVIKITGIVDDALETIDFTVV